MSTRMFTLRAFTIGDLITDTPEGGEATSDHHR